MKAVQCTFVSNIIEETIQDIIVEETIQDIIVEENYTSNEVKLEIYRTCKDFAP